MTLPLPHLADDPATVACLPELIELVQAFAPADGLHDTPIRSLQLLRASAPGQPLPAVYEPGLCVVVQGRKLATLGADRLVYDPLHYLLISVTMLPRGQVVMASPEQPYLCIRLNADPREVGDLLMEATPAAPAGPRSAIDRGLRVAQVSAPLLDAVLRLMRLLRAPQDAPVLAPLAVREIYYRVLTGELGAQLRMFAVADSQSRRVARAVDLLKRRYTEPVRIDELADAAHMSASSLHQHFKLLTSMSPLRAG
jgi:hypothetical protein